MCLGNILGHTFWYSLCTPCADFFSLSGILERILERDFLLELLKHMSFHSDFVCKTRQRNHYICLSGSWNTVKYNGFVWLWILASHTADPLCELEHCKHDGFRWLRILASHTADPLWELEHYKILWFCVVADSGFAYCRSSLGAGTL